MPTFGIMTLFCYIKSLRHETGGVAFAFPRCQLKHVIPTPLPSPYRKQNPHFSTLDLIRTLRSTIDSKRFYFRIRAKKEEFQDEDLLGDNDGEIDEMTLRIDNLTREIEKSKQRQKIMMNTVDQQRDILLAVADQIGVEINLPSRVKIE